MSSFKCEQCGAAILDAPGGYITGCKHFPLPNLSNLSNQSSKEKKSSDERKRQYPPLTPEDIGKIVDLFPTHSYKELASVLHITQPHVKQVIKMIRKEGIPLVHKRIEVFGVIRVAIKDYIKQKNETLPQNNPS